jgi:hypothetical protein
MLPHIDTESSCYHFFFGDENTLDLYLNLKNEVERHNHKYIGVLELPDRKLGLPEKRGLLLDVVPQEPEPAASAIAYLERLEPELWELWKKGVFYLSGKDAAVNRFERALYRKSIHPAQIVKI